jgi:hypothetical protein
MSRKVVSTLTAPERVAMHAPDQWKLGSAHHDRGPLGGEPYNCRSCHRSGR